MKWHSSVPHDFQVTSPHRGKWHGERRRIVISGKDVEKVYQTYLKFTILFFETAEIPEGLLLNFQYGDGSMLLFG